MFRQEQGSPVEVTKQAFLEKIRKEIVAVVEKREHRGDRNYFKGFPALPDHYLFSVNRVVFSLLILFSEKRFQIQLFLGENPRDYFIPKMDGNNGMKKTFSRDFFLQSHPYVLGFLKESMIDECWTRIQIPNHKKDSGVIKLVAITLSDLIDKTFLV